jgi:putative transposase
MKNIKSTGRDGFETRLYKRKSIMQKFQGKYRIETARAKWWDYSNEGDYFITICTKNREHLFGYIQDDEIILNEYGEIVSDCWFDLPNHYHRNFK